MKKKRILIIIGILIIFIIGMVLLFLSFSLKLNGQANIILNYKDEYKEEGAIFKIAGQDFSNKIKISGQVDTDKVGEYTKVYAIDLFGINIKKERKISVVDKENPTIILKGDSEVTICPNKEYEEDGYEASDEYDGDLTDKVEKIITDTGNIKYKVVDSSNNSFVIERSIIRKDEVNPILNLKGSSEVAVKVNTEYNEQGYEVSDNCDNNVKVVIDNKVDTSVEGTYKVTYTATDSAGNKTVKTRNVTVNKTGTLPGVIYLTFDDGPSGSTTPKILDILKKYDVKATFFVTGSGPDNLIKREFEEGHTVALHTYTHDYAKVYSSVDNYFSDLDRIQNRVFNITGVKSTITRFPGGSNNTVNKKYNSYQGGIMSTLKKEVSDRGYTYFDWNVNDADSEYKTSSNPNGCLGRTHSESVQCVYNNVTRNLSRNRDNIVLLHDIKSHTADAIESIVQYGKNNGYEFRAITADTKQLTFR